MALEVAVEEGEEEGDMEATEVVVVVEGMGAFEVDHLVGREVLRLEEGALITGFSYLVSCF